MAAIFHIVEVINRKYNYIKTIHGKGNIKGMEKYFEIFFNIAYLIVVWILVIKMNNRKKLLVPSYKREGILILSAFFLLALGDTGHVGFRVLAFVSGGLEKN